MCLPTHVKGSVIQRIATTVGNLLCLNFGLMFGITPPHARLYQSANTPLLRIIGEKDAHLLSAYLFASVAIGALFSGWMAKKIGSKSVLYIGGLFQIASWFTIHFANAIIHIHFSRIFAGLSAGLAFVVLPIFISEFADDANRQKLIASTDQMRTLGIVLGFLLGTYLPYWLVPIIGLGTSLFYTFNFAFIQDTPYYYMDKENFGSLEKSLRWYRGIRDLDSRLKSEFVMELRKFEAEFKGPKLAEWGMPHAFLLRICLICLLLFAGAQMSGAYLILNNADKVFEGRVPSMGVDGGVIILALAQFVGASFTAWVGEKIKRKFLLCFSSLICGVSLVFLALYTTYGSQWQVDPHNVPGLTLGVLSVHMLFANVGLFPLATVIASEVVPMKVCHLITSITVALSWVVPFALTHYVVILREFFGVVGFYWLFAGSCLIVALLSLVLVPETRGVSPGEVQIQMGYVGSNNVARTTAVTVGHINTGYV